MAGYRRSGDLAAAARCGTEPSLTSPGVGSTCSERSRRGGIAWQNGMSAEDAACAALIRDGFTVLQRRARTAAGEIDIVAERRSPGAASLLAFVEVKARPGLSTAATSLSARQQARLLAAASILLGLHPDWNHDDIRFDLMLVDGNRTVRRIIDAFRIEHPE